MLYVFESPSFVSILHILTFLSLEEVKSTTGQNLHFVFIEEIFSFLRNFTHVINLSCASLTCASIFPVSKHHTISFLSFDPDAARVGGPCMISRHATSLRC